MHGHSTSNATDSPPPPSIHETALAWCADHPGDWPDEHGRCPACGGGDCFGRMPNPRDRTRWVCFDTDHVAAAAGRKGDACWTGDALDLEAHQRRMSRIDVLVADGYLPADGDGRGAGPDGMRKRPAGGRRSGPPAERKPQGPPDLRDDGYWITTWPQRNRPRAGERRAWGAEALAAVVRDPPALPPAGKETAPLWQLATYKDDYRSKATLEAVGALYLDADSEAGPPERGIPSLTVAVLVGCFGAYRHVIHTTPSHSPSAARLRVLLPLSRMVGRGQYQRLAEWAFRVASDHGLAAAFAVDDTWRQADRWHFAPALTEHYDYAIDLTLPRLDVDAALAQLDEWEAAERAFTRHEIKLSTDIEPVTLLAVEALRAGERNLYQRGGKLVRTLRDGVSAMAGARMAPGALTVADVPPEQLRSALSRSAEWLQEVTKPGGESWLKPVLPPVWVVASVRTRGEWSFRPLRGVIEAPTLRPDGTLLTEPGYDSRTGLYYDPPVGLRVPVPVVPTHAEAKQAYDLLFDLVCDFPFERDYHRSAAVAAIVTLVCRAAVDGCVPAFLFDATTPGSGKTLLANLAGIIATGRSLPAVPPTGDDEEWRKRITVACLEGWPAVLIDNVVGDFGNAPLDAALTSRDWTDRVLGVSESTGRLPLLAVWFVTGNNLELKADLPRRVVPIRLTPKEESPELRTGFVHSLPAAVNKDRTKYLTAALTVVRAYIVAGRPRQELSAFGSFEEWSDLIRSALVWAGAVDPCAGCADVRRSGDLRRADLGGLLHAWYVAQGGNPRKLSEVLRVLTPPAPPIDPNAVPTPRARPEDLEFRDALLGFAAACGVVKLDGHSLGNVLRRYRDRHVGGYRLCTGERVGGTATWCVVRDGDG